MLRVAVWCVPPCFRPATAELRRHVGEGRLMALCHAEYALPFRFSNGLLSIHLLKIGNNRPGAVARHLRSLSIAL